MRRGSDLYLVTNQTLRRAICRLAGVLLSCLAACLAAASKIGVPPEITKIEPIPLA
jgi:hypothetical protein